MPNIDEKKLIEYLEDMQGYFAKMAHNEHEPETEAAYKAQFRFCADLLLKIDRGEFNA